MKQHVPEDVDSHNPMSEKPFWQWLLERDGANPVFHKSLLNYLDVDDSTPRPIATSDQLMVYKHTFHHFWFLKLRNLLETK